jgi:hypothetical protein
MREWLVQSLLKMKSVFGPLINNKPEGGAVTMPHDAH